MISWRSYVLGLITGLLLAAIALPITRISAAIFGLAVALAVVYVLFLRQEPREKINRGEKHNGEDSGNSDR